MLVYLTNVNKTVNARYWDGASWSAPATIFAGSDLITHLAVAAKPDGEFGVAFYDDPFNLRFAESSSSGASWGAPVSLGTDALSIYAGIGLVYRSNGECAIAVERDITNKGIWVGIIPNGGSVTLGVRAGNPGNGGAGHSGLLPGQQHQAHRDLLQHLGRSDDDQRQDARP